MMCRLLEVSRSGYYAWAAHPEPDDLWVPLKIEVKAAWERSGGRFGARMVQASLGFENTLYRIRKCMAELGISGVVPRAKKRTTIADPDAPSRPDLIRRRFDAPVATCALVGDITYLKTGEGWLYLSAVIDLNTRMAVGWAFSDSLATPLVIRSLDMAYARDYIAANAVFHTDRGAQYTSHMLARWAQEHDVRLSVGRTGSCRDNAVAESFFASLKNEMYHHASFATRDEAKAAVIDYIEADYNRMRPHSSIGYQIPAEVMEAFMRRCDAAFSETAEALAAA